MTGLGLKRLFHDLLEPASKPEVGIGAGKNLYKRFDSALEEFFNQGRVFRASPLLPCGKEQVVQCLGKPGVRVGGGSLGPGFNKPPQVVGESGLARLNFLRGRNSR